MPQEQKQPNAVRYEMAEMVEITGCCQESVYAACQRGEIPHLRVGRRIIFPKAAIDKWLETAAVLTGGRA